MLKQSLQQKLLQKLSHQQILYIKLLQIPTFALEQRIKEELEDNPVLEEGKETETETESVEDVTIDKETESTDAESETDSEVESSQNEEKLDIDEFLQDDDIAGYRLSTNNKSDEEDKEIPIATLTSFQEMLLEQVRLCNFDKHQYKIAKQIIGSIDDDGYMRREIASIVDDLAFTQNITAKEEEILSILEAIQKFDPPGVGARSLQECLILQLKRKEHISNGIIKKSILIVENYLNEFTKKHYQKIAKELILSEKQLKKACGEITKLNPKPGSAITDNVKMQHVIPDFEIINIDGKLELKLNSRNAPELRVNQSYIDMFKSYEKTTKIDKKLKETVQFVKQKLDSAKWFIDSIKQRQQTLLKTMSAIMNHQYEFFLTGDDTKLKPLILKDIADTVKLDISTISRVTSSKYVQTEFGTFLLKSFFSERMQDNSGDEVSTRKIKSILRDCIDNENKKNPLPDEKLMRILDEKGYPIARRTIAKYREQLKIPVARLRKQL